MSKSRPAKYIRLNFWKNDPGAALILLGEPHEVRLQSTPTSFLSVTEEGVTISPGTSGKVNIQALSGSLTYGGMITDLPFPLSMIPSTPVTPLPSQVFRPPMSGLMDTLKDLALLTSLFLSP